MPDASLSDGMCESGGGGAPGALTHDKTDLIDVASVICRMPGAQTH